METEMMIRQLKYTANKHMHDTLRTFDTNITALCNDVIPKLEQLKKYEGTGITSEQLKIIEEEYSRMARELSVLWQQNWWIPVVERLPKEPENGMVDMEDLTEYIVTICGAERATALRYAGDGKWYDVETEDFYIVSAWMPLPEPYKEREENEAD